ncbi:MAG: hypothetical protein K2O18_02875 [Oscillospiraceae bacterium]|nr:hypothetical protein [Oscillospiraceae bacterium]
MKNYNECLIDQEVLPLVRFFNKTGLTTSMSCQGHNKTNMSMLWIEFDRSVTSEDIIKFQRDHTNQYGGFCCNGRFVMRILANTTGVEYSYQYMAATIEAAKEDLERWEKNSKDTP